MKRKTLHPNRKSSNLSLYGGPFEIKYMLSMREKGFTERDKEVLMKAEWDWVQSEDSLDLNQFYRAVGIARTTFERLINSDERVKFIHAQVKDFLGERRQNMAFFPKKYDADSSTIRMTLRNYHHDWRAMFNEDAELKKKDAEANKTIIAVLEKYPDEEIEAVES